MRRLRRGRTADRLRGHPRAQAVAALLSGLLLTGATSVGHDASAAVHAGSSLAGRTLEVVGAWHDAEQKSFRAVLDRFEQETGAKVAYTSAGDDVPATLTARISRGNPPDVAMLPQPGLLADLVAAGRAGPDRRPRGREGRCELRVDLADARQHRRHALRRLVQGRRQVTLVVRRPGLRTRSA